MGSGWGVGVQWGEAQPRAILIIQPFRLDQNTRLPLGVGLWFPTARGGLAARNGLVARGGLVAKIGFGVCGETFRARLGGK